MSVVTMASITTLYACDEITVRLTEVIAPETDEREQNFEAISTRNAGGTKFYTNGIYAAAFNYLPKQTVISWFQSLPWGDADCAILLIEGEDDNEPTIVKVTDGKSKILGVDE